MSAPPKDEQPAAPAAFREAASLRRSPGRPLFTRTWHTDTRWHTRTCDTPSLCAQPHQLCCTRLDPHTPSCSPAHSPAPAPHSLGPRARQQPPDGPRTHTLRLGRPAAPSCRAPRGRCRRLAARCVAPRAHQPRAAAAPRVAVGPHAPSPHHNNWHWPQHWQQQQQQQQQQQRRDITTHTRCPPSSANAALAHVRAGRPRACPVHRHPDRPHTRHACNTPPAPGRRVPRSHKPPPAPSRR